MSDVIATLRQSDLCEPGNAGSRGPSIPNGCYAGSVSGREPPSSITDLLTSDTPFFQRLTEIQEGCLKELDNIDVLLHNILGKIEDSCQKDYDAVPEVPFPVYKAGESISRMRKISEKLIYAQVHLSAINSKL